MPNFISEDQIERALAQKLQTCAASTRSAVTRKIWKI